MMSPVVRAVLIVAIPLVVFFGGTMLMTRLSGRATVDAQLESLPDKSDRTKLNTRLHYDREKVARHWGALKPDGLAAETRFLEMDLVFPLAYGGAYLAGLLLGWAALGRSFNPTWLVLVVAVTLLADWTENLTLLGQIEAFARGGATTLNAGRIALASAATLVKLAGGAAVTVAVVVMAVQVLRRAG
jgi:hypothetical protein